MNSFERALKTGETYLGIELGSTRIKAVLIDKTYSVIASGCHTWENKLIDGMWTYELDDIWTGIRNCYADLATNVREKYGLTLKTFGAIGVSAMMHGYMAFDKDGKQLVPFRTWRNTMTGKASERLTALFGCAIPQRWSIAHLFQAILNEEPHIPKIRFLTTLAGYIHWKLTGEQVLGIGDASGMFPIDGAIHHYDTNMLQKFDTLIADSRFSWTLSEILPKILLAGEQAGVLTQQGAKLLDPTGALCEGIPMCPPEGDAGAGMVATNSVRQRTGNVSAGTSVFAMIVLEKPLTKFYPEVDIVTTPSGDTVAMVHCNNCLGDLDAWVKLFGEAASLLGAEFDMDTLYCRLVGSALGGDKSCRGLVSYNYISGEHITGFEKGRPLFMRTPDEELNIANFMRTHMYSACASLKIGMRILLEEESVAIDSITGHGGYFKVRDVGQRIMAAAVGAPVKVMATASEGGPWGMAILASYMILGRGKTLPNYLAKIVFIGSMSETVKPDTADVAGFNVFIARYKAGLTVEKAAVETLNNISEKEKSI